ncbi:MAG: hypothetical protein J2P45_28905, partial [Candidatus Dormibacteraeota bacterium]|nr:hypothetical protein [Candidatus Dormibacteraeota bacterium]
APLPAGLPPQLAELMQRLAHDVFVNAYVASLRPALAVAVACLVIGALTCTLVKRRGARAAAEPGLDSLRETA